jgi:voltage-gated potassium channel
VFLVACESSADVLGAGLICIVAQPLNLPYAEWRWIDAILWLCLAFFALEWALHVWDWSKSDHFRARLLSVQHLADIIAVVPIVVGMALGLPATTAWLLGAFWLLKLPGATSGFSLLGHVFLAEAKPIASVLKVFASLVMAAVAMHLSNGTHSPRPLNLPNALCGP